MMSLSNELRGSVKHHIVTHKYPIIVDRTERDKEVTTQTHLKTFICKMHTRI